MFSCKCCDIETNTSDAKRVPWDTTEKNTEMFDVCEYCSDTINKFSLTGIKSLIEARKEVGKFNLTGIKSLIEARKEVGEMSAKEEAVIDMFEQYFKNQSLETQARCILNLSVESFRKYVVIAKSEQVEKLCEIVGTSKRLLEQLKEL